VKLTRAERANTRADAAAKEAATDKATTTDEEVAVEKNWDAASTEDTAPKNTNEHIASMNNVSFEEESPAKKDTEMEEEAEEQDRQVIDGEKEDVEMETPNSPIRSPVKKKSKRASLNSLVTPNAKPSEESSKQPTKPNQSSKRKADAPTDPKEVTPAPAEKSAPKATVDPPSESHAEKASAKPSSVLKSGKYPTSTSSASKNKLTEKPAPKLHVHKFQRVIIDGAVDFSKAALAPFEENVKKFQEVLSILMNNIGICDDKAIINHKDVLSLLCIGPGGQKPPGNMTALRN
jgi:hypothetical protein